MFQDNSRRKMRLTLLAGSSALLLAACGNQPLDFDLRGLGGGFSTADAATAPLAARPKPIPTIRLRWRDPGIPCWMLPNGSE